MQKATNCSCTLFPNGNKVLIFMQLRLGHCKETSFPAFQLAIIFPQSTRSDLELSNLVRIYYQNSLSSDTRELIYMYLESETWIFVRVEPNNSNPMKNCRILGCNLKILLLCLKSNICNSTLIFRTGFHCHIFLHLLSHFRGFEPHPRRYSFLKSDLKWAFSYILIYQKFIL